MRADPHLALTAVTRFGLGAAPGELAVVARDPRAWAEAEAARPPEVPDDPGPSGAAAADLFVQRRQVMAQRDRERSEAIRAGGEAPPAPPAVTPADRGFTLPVETVTGALASRIALAATTRAPFAERLVLHWTDHLTASAAANFVGYFAPAHENEAVRPHLHGSFADLLVAAVLHPAMLFYLDGRNSVGPNSIVGQRSRGRRGLNENLAREVLELHALGADGGYEQSDVVALAAVLTGWTVDVADTPRGPSRIAFDPEAHEPGPKTILGRTYPEAGAGQAPAVLRDLARHAACSRHVARRFVRHVVGHGPPALEARMAETLRRTEGDLGALTLALVRDPEAWGAPRKVRPPVEILFATARLLGGLPGQPAPQRALRAMGQPFWSAAAPKGWPMEDEAWAAPDSIKTRLDWALEVAARIGPDTDARALLDAAFGPAASNETRRAVERAADRRQALAILLMSPEFQRR